MRQFDFVWHTFADGSQSVKVYQNGKQINIHVGQPSYLRALIKRRYSFRK